MIKFKNTMFFIYFYSKYTVQESNVDFFFYKTKVKVNYKYFVSMLVNDYMFFFLGKRSQINISFKKFNSMLRFFNINYISLLILSKLLLVNNFCLIFFYKNFHFLNLNFFFDFFKLLNCFFIEDFYLMFNFNLIFQANRYFKKIKTIKKFKKKIYQKQLRFLTNTTYFI